MRLDVHAPALQSRAATGHRGGDHQPTSLKLLDAAFQAKTVAAAPTGTRSNVSHAGCCCWYSRPAMLDSASQQPPPTVKPWVTGGEGRRKGAAAAATQSVRKAGSMGNRLRMTAAGSAWMGEDMEPLGCSSWAIIMLSPCSLQGRTRHVSGREKWDEGSRSPPRPTLQSPTQSGAVDVAMGRAGGMHGATTTRAQ